DERGALDKIDTEIADSRAEVQRLDSEIATHRNRIEFNRQRAQELAELTERARRDEAEAENKRNQQAARIKETNSSIAEIERNRILPRSIAHSPKNDHAWTCCVS